MHSPSRATAQLAERLRSDLPGYAVSLTPHPARGTGGDTRAARIVIAAPYLEAICWVEDGDGVAGSAGAMPEPVRVVEIRVILHVPGLGGAPAALAGESIAVDERDLPVEEALAAIARLIDEDLTEECFGADQSTRNAFEAGRSVYLNDWPG
jgi:hypothetical protein